MSENILFRTAVNKAMAQCSRREFCISEVQAKLDSWGVDITDNEKIIRLLINENYINEERFARAFANDKFNYNRWGKVKIAAHLRGKKIPGEVISIALDAIDSELYKKTLKELVSGHRPVVKAKNQYELKAKLLRYGLSKGFESNLLFDILNEPED